MSDVLGRVRRQDEVPAAGAVVLAVGEFLEGQAPLVGAPFHQRPKQ